MWGFDKFLWFFFHNRVSPERSIILSKSGVGDAWVCDGVATPVKRKILNSRSYKILRHIWALERIHSDLEQLISPGID